MVSLPFTIDVFPIVVSWFQSRWSRWLFSCLVICCNRSHGSSCCEWFIYEGLMSNFCCSSPPKSSRCTSCRIRRGQPIIVDRLHMAIFVLNRSGSLAREFLEGYWHFSLFSWFEQRFSPLTMNSNQITIFKLPVVLIGSLNRPDIDSLRFMENDVVHKSDVLRWRRSLRW